MAAGKRLVADLTGPVDAAQVAMTIEALVTRWESAESAEGIAAFFDKRKPGVDGVEGALPPPVPAPPGYF